MDNGEPVPIIAGIVRFLIWVPPLLYAGEKKNNRPDGVKR